ncbi:MAG: hypothetical protein M3Y33_09465 [Actinomycetota bacterium]|nr:hypothetical protein [Actinomycetota bacterium]
MTADMPVHVGGLAGMREIDAFRAGDPARPFHPGRLPQRVWWAEWQDYREPDPATRYRQPVTLDAEHAACHRLDVLDRGGRARLGILTSEARSPEARSREGGRHGLV